MCHERGTLFYIFLYYIPYCVCNCNLERRNVVSIFVNDFILNEYRYLYIISYIHMLMFFCVYRAMSRNTCAFNNFQINVNPKLSRSRSPSVLRDRHTLTNILVYKKNRMQTYFAFFVQNLKYRHVALINTL